VLKITVTETQTESRWILQGQLVGPWVRELRKHWKEKHTTESLKSCVVDLNEVTFIDKSGERLLRAMYKKGADLTADGMYTKHLLEKLKIRKSNLRRLLLCLCVGFVTIAVNFPYVAGLGRLNTRQGFAARQHFQSRRENSINSRARTANHRRGRDCLLAISQLRAAVERNHDEKEDRR
jgi:hypothetical protein